MRVNEVSKAMVSFAEAIGIAEGVKNAADVKRVGTVSTEAEEMEEAESGVNVTAHCAQLVNASRPVGCVGYVDGSNAVVVVFC